MTTNLPTWDHYCSNTTKANAIVFSLPGIDVYFSYKTPVAYRISGRSLIVRKNDWGVTTGKHINAIDGGGATAKLDRIRGHQFVDALALALKIKASEVIE